jgi:hypothetical protein
MKGAMKGAMKGVSSKLETHCGECLLGVSCRSGLTTLLESIRVRTSSALNGGTTVQSTPGALEKRWSEG